jgi:diguanylate cyclase (GGDEF)-like protein/PAS domain S-box-containing protein
VDRFRKKVLTGGNLLANSRVLVAAPEAEPLEHLGEMLRAEGYQVTELTFPGVDLNAVAAARPDLALVAVVGAAARDGIETSRGLRASLGIPVVYVVNGWTADLWARARVIGPAGYLLTQVRPVDLRAALDLAFRRHHEEVQLRREMERYRILFQQNVAGVYRKTLGGVILNCNQSFARLFGYDGPEELHGRPAEILYGSPSDRREFLDKLGSRGIVTNYELPMKRKDGTPIWVLENAVISAGPAGDRPVVVGTLIDITDRKSLETRLERLANQDPLTGLANRRALETRANQVLELAVRRGEVGALLFLDLVRFKAVNDTLGHSAGDRVLVEVGRRMQSALRASDTAARVGGDEFVVLLSDVDDEHGALEAARRILGRFDAPVAVEGEAVRVDLRVGVVLFPTSGRDLDALMARAGRVVSTLKPLAGSAIEVYQPN